MAAAVRGSRSAANHVLVTIRFSHYNEKARWALDWHKVPYYESAWLPMLSNFGVLWHGGWQSGKADNVSTRLSTPLLVTDRGVRYHDSRSILEYADATFGTPATSLLPVPEALTLDKHYHDKLGPHTRRVAYYHLLQDPELLFDICKENVGDRQTAVFKASWPLMKSALGKLGLSKEKAAKSYGYIQKEFDAAAERLAGHTGDFLLGPRFTAADIAFASLAAPVLMVQPWEGYGGYLPPVEDLPDGLRTVVQELRAHPAGQYAMRMFRLHRGDRQIPGEPALRTQPPHDVLSRPAEGRSGGGGMGPGVV